MPVQNGDGNGVAGALRAALILGSLIAVVAGSLWASHYILTQQIESNRSERSVILDGMRAELADHAQRIGLLEQHAAASKETVREIETQFKWANEVRAQEDEHLRELFELVRARER